MEWEIIRICAMAVLCAVVGAVLGRAVGGLEVAIKLSGFCLVIGGVIAILSEVVSTVDALGVSAEVEKYSSVMLKGLGIAVLCRVSADVCRDCGEPTVAAAVESAGKLTMLLLSMPLIGDIVTLAADLLEKI